MVFSSELQWGQDIGSLFMADANISSIMILQTLDLFGENVWHEIVDNFLYRMERISRNLHEHISMPIEIMCNSADKWKYLISNYPLSTVKEFISICVIAAAV